jgi:hypothetical protein
MATFKILQPPVIEVPPFPQQGEGQFNNTTSQEGTKDNKEPEKTEWRTLPAPGYAKEMISHRLDTIAGLIKGAFEFTKFAALRIGRFLEGETGEITITGNGISAVDINGKTTFALDGRNGDATFSGELAAGGIITGKIDMGKDGYIIGGDLNTYRWILGKLP